jgi:hypothetical protein
VVSSYQKSDSKYKINGVFSLIDYLDKFTGSIRKKEQKTLHREVTDLPAVYLTQTGRQGRLRV